MDRSPETGDELGRRLAVLSQDRGDEFRIALLMSLCNHSLFIVAPDKKIPRRLKPDSRSGPPKGMHRTSGAAMRLPAFFALLATTTLPGQQTTSPRLEELTGKTFILVSAAAGENTIPFPARPAITMKFGEAGKITGSAPVNLYMGSIELTEDGTLVWGPAGLAVTRRAGPPTLMELESLFFQGLERATSVALDGSRLVFSSSQPRFSFVFEEQAAPAAFAEYFDRLLTVTQLNVDGAAYPLPAQPRLNLTVSSDGRAAGFAGVNRFFGKLEISADGGVAAGRFGSTLMAGPEELMKLEQAYLKALEQTRRIETSGRAVRFLNRDGIAVVAFELR